MTLYDITLSGCDDTTDLLDVELSDAEHAAIERIAALADEEGGGCKPVMRVVPAAAAPPDGEFCRYCWERLNDAPATRRHGGWAHRNCDDENAPTETGA